MVMPRNPILTLQWKVWSKSRRFSLYISDTDSQMRDVACPLSFVFYTCSQYNEQDREMLVLHNTEEILFLERDLSILLGLKLLAHSVSEVCPKNLCLS